MKIWSNEKISNGIFLSVFAQCTHFISQVEHRLSNLISYAFAEIRSVTIAKLFYIKLYKMIQTIYFHRRENWTCLRQGKVPRPGHRTEKSKFAHSDFDSNFYFHFLWFFFSMIRKTFFQEQDIQKQEWLSEWVIDWRTKIGFIRVK